MNAQTQRQWDDFHADFEDALTFVTMLHANQLRKGTDTPYIAHLLAVASLVLEHGGGRDEAIAALLHDSIEDQAEHYPGGAAALRTEIVARYGQSVLDLVEACTDADVVPKPPWRARKESYISHLDHVSPGARLVSCADKLHNARAIVADLRIHGYALWQRFNGGREGSLWYYQALSGRFQQLGPNVMAGELARVVEDMKKLADLG